MNTTLPELRLPPCTLRVRPGALPGSRPEVFCALRRRWVALTPEEHVRQAFTAMLITHLGYPAGLMANEVAMRLNGTARRCDTVVFTRAREPLLIVEYKAPAVTLTRAVFEQVVRYNLALRAPWLMVSNGLHHFALATPPGQPPRFLPQLPAYSDICSGEASTISPTSATSTEPASST